MKEIKTVEDFKNASDEEITEYLDENKEKFSSIFDEISTSGYADSLIEVMDISNSEIEFNGRFDHEMSGYGGRFEAADKNAVLRIKGNQFEVETIMSRFGGSIPNRIARMVDEGDLEWEDVRREDYDEYREGSPEKETNVKLFDTFDEAMEEFCSFFDGDEFPVEYLIQ